MATHHRIITITLPFYLSIYSSIKSSYPLSSAPIHPPTGLPYSKNMPPISILATFRFAMNFHRSSDGGRLNIYLLTYIYIYLSIYLYIEIDSHIS